MQKPLDIILNNDNLKLCSICGLKTKLSFEHMPPRATGNDKPVNIIGLENMIPLGGYLYGKFKKSPKGMGGYKLCRSCNELTGSWYAESYIDLTNQLNKLITENIGKKDVELKCKIKPLNFFKQVICLLLSADQANGILREIVGRTNFILNKEENVLSNEIYISKLITLQPTYGFKGFSPIWDSTNGFSNGVEFVYRPLYFKATFNPNEMENNSIDITKFKEFTYDEEIEVRYKIDLDKFQKTNSSPNLSH